MRERRKRDKEERRGKRREENEGNDLGKTTKIHLLFI
jgi:hypothetical protein